MDNGSGLFKGLETVGQMSKNSPIFFFVAFTRKFINHFSNTTPENSRLTSIFHHSTLCYKEEFQGCFDNEAAM